jgi:hypothetical protein
MNPGTLRTAREALVERAFQICTEGFDSGSSPSDRPPPSSSWNISGSTGTAKAPRPCAKGIDGPGQAG